MNRYFEIRKSAVVGWVIVFCGLSVLLGIFDNYYVKPNAIFYLDNYSNIIYIIWQIQATFTGLILAVLSLIVGKLDEKFLGFSVKELLFIHSQNTVHLNLWETVILALCSIIISGISIFFNSMVSISGIFLITFATIVFLTWNCINIIIQTDKYEERAKKFISDIATVALSEPNTLEIQSYYTSKFAQHNYNPALKVKESRQLLVDILLRIKNELSAKIEKNENIISHKTYLELFEIDRFVRNSGDTEFSIQIHQVVNDLLADAIKSQSDNNIYTLFGYSIIEPQINKYKTTGCDMLLTAYYDGRLDNTIFKRIIDNLDNDIQQRLGEKKEVVLAFLKSTIDNADKVLFSRIINSVCRVTSYTGNKSQGEVLFVILFYLYYITFKESDIHAEKGSDYVNKLKEFLELIIFDHQGKVNYAKIVSEKNILLAGSNFLFEFFKGPFAKWEYLSVGHVKTLRLENDAAEFFIFYCTSFFKNDFYDKSIFDNIELDLLKKFRNYIEHNGDILDVNSFARLSTCDQQICLST
jgi:hypothetical protein